MDERKMETGDSDPAAPELDEDERARLIGDIVAEWISSLGSDQAFMSGGVVKFTPDALNGIERPGCPRVGLVRDAREIHACSTGYMSGRSS